MASRKKKDCNHEGCAADRTSGNYCREHYLLIWQLKNQPKDPTSSKKSVSKFASEMLDKYPNEYIAEAALADVDYEDLEGTDSAQDELLGVFDKFNMGDSEISSFVERIRLDDQVKSTKVYDDDDNGEPRPLDFDNT